MAADRSRIRKSLFWSFLERYVGIALTFVSFPILARLLTPAEIGIYSVSVAFVTFAHVVRDFGVAHYIIQEKDLSTQRMRAMFGIFSS